MPKFAIATALLMSSSVLSFQLTTTPLNKRSLLVQGNRQRNSMLAEHLNLLQDHSLLTSSLDAVQSVMSNMMQQQPHIDVQSLHTTLNLADGDVVAVPDTVDAVATVSSGLYKVDKTGFIGFFADLFEQAIDILHDVAKKTGAESTYGLAIVFFTFLIKAATLPLTVTQLESTTKMQKLTPLQQKIGAKFPNKEDEQKKNQMVAQLFQAANVNPLAGCFPSLVQIPVFISLYRALQNLIAENKLDEPFLWIPDLEGPVYKSVAGDSTNWFYSIFSGTPALGWDDTRAFLTLPVILFISQSISTRILQPPRDPNKVLTEQEQFSQGLVNNLPFIVAFFSLNVPAGLGIYWITNNILTTVITLVVKASIKDEPMPTEVAQMMAALDAPTGGAMRVPSPSSRAMMKSSIVDESKAVSGFGSGSGSTKVVDVEGAVEGEGSEGEGEDGEDEEEGDKTESEGAADDSGKKRKKRQKPASKKDGKKK